MTNETSPAPTETTQVFIVNHTWTGFETLAHTNDEVLFDFDEEIAEGLTPPSEEVLSDAKTVVEQYLSPGLSIGAELLDEGKVAINFDIKKGHSVSFICKPDRTISVHEVKRKRYRSMLLSDMEWLREFSSSKEVSSLTRVMEVHLALGSFHFKFSETVHQNWQRNLFSETSEPANQAILTAEGGAQTIG